MRRFWGRSWALGAALILSALTGCEALLDTNHLQERLDGGAERDATFANAGDATQSSGMGADAIAANPDATVDATTAEAANGDRDGLGGEEEAAGDATLGDADAADGLASEDGNEGTQDGPGPDGDGTPDDGAASDADAAPDAPPCSVPCTTGVCDDGGTVCTGFTSGTVNPSCAALEVAGLNHCGVDGDSCCLSLEVPAGSYYQYYVSDQGDGAPSNEADLATVSGFRLDKYLVTVGRFRAFVTAWNQAGGPEGGTGVDPQPGSGRHTHINGGSGLNSTLGGYEPGWSLLDDPSINPTDAQLTMCTISTWTSDAGGAGETMPMNCVNWFEAYAFCIWDGGFLPTAAEWELAAAGGGAADGQREYPWGSVDPGAAGTAFAYAVFGTTQPQPVGITMLGRGRWGQFDLVGDVAELNLDWSENPVAYTDCVKLGMSNGRSTSGSWYGNGTEFLNPPASFYYLVPAGRGAEVGFRCARVP
jgi:formylglycine-generating enzyme required for sulfatase activity